MNTKKQTLVVVSILILLTMFTSACGFHPRLIGTGLQSTTFDVNVDMSEHSDVHFSFHGHDFWTDLLDHVERTELHDGFVRYVGYNHGMDGTRQYGSVDLSLESENGTLIAKIIAVDIPGVELTDPLVTRINSEMRSELSWLGYGPEVKVTFHDVRVTEESISMKVQVDLDL